MQFLSAVTREIFVRDFFSGKGAALALTPLLVWQMTVPCAFASSSGSNKQHVRINSFIPSVTTTMGGASSGSSSENSAASISAAEPLAPSAPVVLQNIGSQVQTASTPTVTQAQAQCAPLFKEAAIAPEADECGWSLPILGQMHAQASKMIRHSAKVAMQQDKPLEGSITSDDSNAGAQVDRLIDAALDRDSEAKVIDRAVTHFRKPSQVAIAQAKDATDYVVPYRGFGPSSEAGDIILDEQVKLKSRASAEYARQKHIDELHLKVVSNMFQMAMGLGMADQSRGGEVTQTGFAALKELVGEEEATKTKEMLLAAGRDAQIPQSTYDQPMWDVTQKQEKHKLIVETSLDEDPVVHEIKKRVHKYNQHSKFSMAASHVIGTTLGAASLTPTFIGPAAKLALLTYVMATGGPEQVKLLKELYLDKRFESRCKVVNEEAHLALDNYQLALLTRNPVLLTCAQSIMGQLVPEDTVQNVCGASMIAEHKTAPGA